MGNFQSIDQVKFPLKIRKNKRYGCIPDIPDQRDIWTTFPKTIEHYQTADLRKTNFLPEILDQGELGSSVAHALLAAFVFSLKKDGVGTELNFSPQFIYYNQRFIAGTIESDSGASLRDGIKVLERLGVCSEELYPYNLDFFRERPTDESYEFAYKNKHPIQYRRVRFLLEDIMKSISIKIPVLMGFTVYESFQHPDVARTGVMPIPKMGEKIVGHHCTLIVGYDISKKYILCRNNWGSNWGQGGYFWMPFSFVNSRNCSDLWIISTGSGNKPTAKLSNNSKPVEKPVESVVIQKIIEKVPEFKEDEISDNDLEEDENTIV
jgi:C1A family cysteine protease